MAFVVGRVDPVITMMIIILLCAVTGIAGIVCMVIGLNLLIEEHQIGIATLENCVLIDELYTVCTSNSDNNEEIYDQYRYYGVSPKCGVNVTLILYQHNECTTDGPQYELYKNMSCWISDCNDRVFTFDDLEELEWKASKYLTAAGLLLPIGFILCCVVVTICG